MSNQTSGEIVLSSPSKVLPGTDHARLELVEGYSLGSSGNFDEFLEWEICPMGMTVHDGPDGCNHPLCPYRRSDDVRD